MVMADDFSLLQTAFFDEKKQILQIALVIIIRICQKTPYKMQGYTYHEGYDKCKANGCYKCLVSYHGNRLPELGITSVQTLPGGLLLPFGKP